MFCESDTWNYVLWIRHMKLCFVNQTHGIMFCESDALNYVLWIRHMELWFVNQTHEIMFYESDTWNYVLWIGDMKLCFVNQTHKIMLTVALTKVPKFNCLLTIDWLILSHTDSHTHLQGYPSKLNKIWKPEV